MKISDSSSNYFKVIDASNTFLRITDANLNYLNKIDANANYLNTIDASASYLKLVDASNTYLKVSDSSSNYLQIIDARNTYLKINSANAQLSNKASLTDSNTFNGSNTFSGNLTIGNKLNVAANSVLINANFSILSFQLDEYYSVVAGANAGDSAITINLPVVSSSNAGTKVHFRIVSGQGDVTFSSNTLIYSLINATGPITIGNGNSQKTKITLVALNSGPGTYAYYEI